MSKMEGALIVGGVLFAGFLVYQLFDLPKTLLAIAWVSPYEQAGDGAGSIMLIGDSTGYGTGAGRAGESIAGRIGTDYPNYSIKNNSVNGRKIAGAREVVDGLEGNYDLILFQIGANDLLGGVSVEQVVSDMQTLVADAKPHAEHVIVMTSGNIGGAPRFSGDRAEALREASLQYSLAMSNVAQEAGFVFVDLYDDPDVDPFIADPQRYISSDRLHPTGAGYAVWYEKLRPILVELLE